METYPDGSPMVIEYVNPGSIDKSKNINTFYKDNKLQSEGMLKDGKKEGKWVFYYDNGNKWSEGYFKNGIEQGTRTVYYENGKKRYEGSFRNGDKTGLWKFWDKNGELIKEIRF
jgi:antitoxin component YwqK of YwqJK toxin-antitoxin module